jgi:hypothetical protein
MGPRPNVLSDDDEQPVYLLTRRRSSIPPAPESAARAPLASGIAEVDLRTRLARLASDGTREDALQRSPARREARSEAGASWRYATALAPSEDAWTDDDDDASDIRRISGAGRRQRAIRVLGALAIVGSLAGGAFVLQQPKVRREALSFVTMGHEEGAARLGRKVAAIVADLRRR